MVEFSFLLPAFSWELFMVVCPFTPQAFQGQAPKSVRPDCSGCLPMARGAPGAAGRTAPATPARKVRGAETRGPAPAWTLWCKASAARHPQHSLCYRLRQKETVVVTSSCLSPVSIQERLALSADLPKINHHKHLLINLCHYCNNPTWHVIPFSKCFLCGN